jgi:hypothetical protein
MLEVKMAIFECLTLTFDSLSFMCDIVFDTVKAPLVPKYLYKV